MKQKIEPSIPKNQKEMIFGVNQNQYHFPNPDHVYQVDEQGNKIEQKLPDQQLIASHYWAKKKKQIAILGAVSCMIPFSILVQETGIFDMIFEKTAEGIGWAFETIFGAIIP